jgi:hypothetical protein
VACSWYEPTEPPTGEGDLVVVGKYDM